MWLAVTLLVAKSVRRLSRMLGRGGGDALPGLIADRLDPRLAMKLARGLPKGVILVTGTNGKTTTTKLIAEALRLSGERVLTNRTGSNLKRGVTSALVAASKLNGKSDATVGLFEVDEASLRHVAPELQPRHIVVLNLFRDQLDRYGELDTTAAIIGEAIAATDAKLHLNADDPLVVSLAKYARSAENVSFFGIEGMPASVASGHQSAVDSDRCPECHSRLKYARVFFSHLGHYRCPNGDFARPQPSVAITNVSANSVEGSSFTVAVMGRRSEVFVPLPGTYNLYNVLAAISVTSAFGVKQPVISEALSKAEPAFGRVERVGLNGKTVYLLLIKNPAGFYQILETFLTSQNESNVCFAINDLDADGRDVSWLWDVPLEILAGRRPKAIATGIRGTDMALRLQYAGVDAETVPDLEEAIELLLENTPAGGAAYILPTYTAMLQVRKALSKLTQMPEM